MIVSYKKSCKSNNINYYLNFTNDDDLNTFVEYLYKVDKHLLVMRPAEYTHTWAKFADSVQSRLKLLPPDDTEKYRLRISPYELCHLLTIAQLFAEINADYAIELLEKSLTEEKGA